MLPGLDLKIRTASESDADAIARVFSPSFRLLTFLPELHTVAEDRWFIANVILKECEVTLAEHDGSVVSFLARPAEKLPVPAESAAFSPDGRWVARPTRASSSGC